MLPKFTLDKIRFATDPGTFNLATWLYEQGRVTKFAEQPNGYTAIVIGTQPYEVLVDKDHYDEGRCNCYLGQKDILCKHMVTLAIRAVKGGQDLSREEKLGVGGITGSNKLGEPTNEELVKVKQLITEAMKCIKPYNGPSRIWFHYQNSLTEGVNRLAAIFSGLPVSYQTAVLVIKTLLRLDKKLVSGGVDDSDGTVGGLIEEGVTLLKTFAKLDPACNKAFVFLKNQHTCFDWEKPLLNEYNIK